VAKARVFDVENPLAKVICTLGGELPAKLVETADREVAKLHSIIRDYVRDEVAAILIYSSAGEDLLFADSERLGQHALNVAEVAGAAGLDGIGEIAAGINSLIENLRESGLWRPEALRLHLDALTLVSQGGAIDRSGEGLVLRRLRAMRQAIGVQE
jgi:hypothetical protein